MMWHLLTLSGETEDDLNAATRSLANYLDNHREGGLADIAYTLQTGHAHGRFRRLAVCKSREDALEKLTAREGSEIATGLARQAAPKVTFMFPGLGDQYVNMTAELYSAEPRFRASVDRCSEALTKYLGVDPREVIYDSSAPQDRAVTVRDLKQMIGRGVGPAELGRLKETALAQPALFVVEYALAELWRAWGVKPAAMVGYSLGEYVAAAQAGVFSLEDSLQLVALRAELISKLPAGAMLAVGLPEERIGAYLNADLSLSAMNGPMMCVVAGAVPAVAGLEKRLAAGRIACRPVQTTHAFHSYMMRGATEPLRALLRTFRPNYPQVPYISNVTGAWIAPQQAGDADYWAEHMCKPVRFADGLQILWGRPNNIFLEVGLGQTLSGLAMQHPARRAAEHPISLSSLPSAHPPSSDLLSLSRTLGQLWLAGVAVDWHGYHGDTPAARQYGLIEELYGQPC